MGKADARDWHEQQRAEKERKADFETAKDSLYALARMRHWPSADAFEAAGGDYAEVASLLREAAKLIDKAQILVQNQQGEWNA